MVVLAIHTGRIRGADPLPLIYVLFVPGDMPGMFFLIHLSRPRLR